LLGERLVLALAGDPDRGTTEERRQALTGRGARQRNRGDLALDGGVDHRGVGVVRVLVLRLHSTDLPAVAVQESGVTLREDGVLVVLVLGRVALAVRLDQVGPLLQTRDRVRRLEGAGPLAVR